MIEVHFEGSCEDFYNYFSTFGSNKRSYLAYDAEAMWLGADVLSRFQ